MFKEILKSKINITDNLYLRFDIKALITAETEGIDIFDLANAIKEPKKVFTLLKIGMADCFGNATKNVISRVVAKIIENYDADTISLLLQAAILDALPAPVLGGDGKTDRKNFDISGIYSLFVDVMGRTDEEFMSLTLREVMRRWDSYAIFNGYKKPGIEIKTFDDD